MADVDSSFIKVPPPDEKGLGDNSAWRPRILGGFARSLTSGTGDQGDKNKRARYEPTGSPPRAQPGASVSYRASLGDCPKIYHTIGRLARMPAMEGRASDAAPSGSPRASATPRSGRAGRDARRITTCGKVRTAPVRMAMRTWPFSSWGLATAYGKGEARA